MEEKQQRKAAKAFYENWKDKGDEKQHTQMFWSSLLRDVYGIDHPENYLRFEDRLVAETSTQYADVWIPATKVMIEQKSSNKSLDEQIRQSDGTLKTPFEQAETYANNATYENKPRWIICCNFNEFRIHDMNKNVRERKTPVAIIRLDELEKEYHRMNFLVDEQAVLMQKEMEVSMQAGELVGILYDALAKQYKDIANERSHKSLNVLCVRLVFCFYAEDAGLFGKKDMFHDYMAQFKDKPNTFRKELIELFKVLDTKVEYRDPYEDELNAFPYVNGGLFSDETIEIPMFTDDIIDVILNRASMDFDWSQISPTIFGAVFESTLNPETRRKGGMHYTSIENIHKVIDPLFLDNLKAELEEIKQLRQFKNIEKRAIEYQNKLASLKFLDPACGSGNFLTETFISIRRLENEAIMLQNKVKDQQQLGFDGDENPIKVSISQFYGIEINDFAVTVAKTALWIAESQMMKETEDIISMDLNFLPLKTNANIHEGNALRINWAIDVLDPRDCSYIMGNPPFIGMKEMSQANKDDMKLVIPVNKLKQMDYVACWYFKTAEYMKGTDIECAFVSSNSIVQGEQALTIWKPLLMDYKIYINFAYRTFNWDSEASIKAHVHCVIIGFSYIPREKKVIYDDLKKKTCTNINQYLTSYKTIFIDKSGIPICDVEPMTKGAQLIDGGNFIVGGTNEYNEVVKKEPDIKPYIRRYYNARDLINGGEPVYVLYLENCPPNVIRSSKFISNRVNEVYNYRSQNKSPSTNVLKDRPSHYFQPQVPNGESLVVPVVSSINRKYIPICFMPEGVVYTNALFFVDNANIYTFGVLTSDVHMAWARTVCGRLKSDFRYSNTMAYNTFPWPNPTAEQKEKIEQTAQAILDAREIYSDSSLADLYDPLTMPKEILKAHEANDKAVMHAYGFEQTMTEEEIVAELFKLYEQKIKGLK